MAWWREFGQLGIRLPSSRLVRSESSVFGAYNGYAPANKNHCPHGRKEDSKVDMHELIRAHERAGGEFFEDGAMRFFSSRICPTTLTFGRDEQYFFVTSERQSEETARFYTVRLWDANNPRQVETVGLFQTYDTRAQADRACKRAAGK